MIKKAEELKQMKEEVLAQIDETIEKSEKVAEENRELRQKLAEAEAAKESEQTPPENGESSAAAPTP